ncbi:hypothetical protein J2Z66_000484 [Paenibacillus eucommiae]|uniref:Transposase IS110-like N-terminal domain-containing protein n=1 Tax=Paenibacillus eucommiae TaxID=1355755 RepID=A0ABS4IQK6_9BACL|nr:hypothetical protein [Paenibacillus eucommiae]
MKAVPGRKTDVKDAEWICQLLRHGLIKASFIPDRAQRELRELVRYRRSIIEERPRQHNRIQKVLERANIKLGSVVSDIMGVSSKNMLRAIAEGIDDPEELAGMAQRTLKRKKSELELALQGYTSPHRFSNGTNGYAGSRSCAACKFIPRGHRATGFNSPAYRHAWLNKS